ncbi:MAG: metallophosphoesterase [Actinobacteria bacterium]|nr:metallophosphoesterase [Actinomycetota bacterium]
MSDRAPLSAQELRQLLAEHGGWTAAARATGINVSTIKTRASVLGIKVDKPEVGESPVTGPRQTIETGKNTATAEFVEATVNPDDVPTDAELLKRANLDPKLWEVVSRRQSVWEAQGKGGEEKVMRSLRVSYGRIKETLSDLVQPAFGGRPVTVRPPARRKKAKRDGSLVFVLSDWHCPYHDPKLLDVTEQVLLQEQPDRLILNGDLVDWPSVSRHAPERGEASANECIQSAGEVLGRLVAAVPDDCRIQFIPGNHDSNLSRYLLERASAAADLCVAGSKVPVWSLQSLLRFDELGIEMVGSEDRWQHSTVRLTDELIVRHGLSVRAGSAASVLANMKASEFATLSGHTHRLGLAAKTVWKASGRHKVLLGAEVGGMFQMPKKDTDWPGYLAHSQLDWAPGWASVEIEPDGHYSISLASFQNGTLMWRGQRFS